MEYQYPTIARRYLATVIDGFLVGAVFVIASYVFSQGNAISSSIRLVSLFIIVFMYEPISTSKFCTFGQYLMGIRVRRKTNGTYSKIPIVSAYLRLFLKLAFGLVSFFTVPFTKGKRAIHDFLAQTIVIPSQFNPETDTLPEHVTGLGIGFKILFAAIAALFLLLIAIGLLSPDTKVIPGKQVPSRYMTTIRSLGLLERDESIVYFYSDGLFDIKGGMYFVSDRKVAIYSESESQTPILIPFSDIDDMKIEYSQSSFVDSDVNLILKNGDEISFPLSHEENGDKLFFEFLNRQWLKISVK